MDERVGVIGLGIMGSGMVRNLVQAGMVPRVWNRTPAKMAEAEKDGAVSCGGPESLAISCDIILVCVSDTPDVEEVLLGERGVIRGAPEGSLVIDCSTISPKATVRIAAELAKRKIAFLDAPVSGGAEGARKGTLSIMVGGAEKDFQRAMPVFQAIGKTITHVGPIGSGQKAKLVNQILVVVNMLAAAEALVFAKACDLDMEKTLLAISGGAAGSWMLTNRGPQVLANDWRPGFTIDLQQKDVRLALEMAEELGVPLPATALIRQFYALLIRQGCGGEGNHALIKALEQLSGIKARGRSVEMTRR